MNLFYLYHKLTVNTIYLKKDKHQTKRIKFIDFYRDFDKKNNYYTNLLKRFNYKFEIVETNPDILIYNISGITQFIPDTILKFKYNNCKLIYTTSEYEAFNKKSLCRFADLNLTFQYTDK